MKKIIVGKIRSTHGVQGAVKVESYTEPLGNIFDMTLFTEDGTCIELKPLKSTNTRPLICAINNPKVKDKDSAEAFRDKVLYTYRDNLTSIDSEDEFYIEDLIGLNVVDHDHTNIGTVVNVCNFGAGDIIEVKIFSSGKIEMYPFSKDIFPLITSEFILMDLREFRVV